MRHGIEQRADVDRLLVERRYFHRDKQLRFEHAGRKNSIIPDSGFVLRFPRRTAVSPNTNHGLLLHLIELDNGTMPLARLQGKIQTYELWSRSAEGMRYLEALSKQFSSLPSTRNFRLLLIAHGNTKVGDRERLVDTMIQVLDLSGAMRDRVWVTTVETLRKHAQEGDLLSAAICTRPRHAKPWLHTYRALEQKLSNANARRGLAQRRDFIRDKLATMPTHPLL